MAACWLWVKGRVEEAGGKQGVGEGGPCAEGGCLAWVGPESKQVSWSCLNLKKLGRASYHVLGRRSIGGFGNTRMTLIALHRGTIR